MSDERRQEPRKTLRTPATVRVAGQALQVRTLDVSVSGVAIVAAVNPPAGMRLELEFLLPGRKGVVPVRARGQVMHSVLCGAENGFRVGVTFTELDDASRRAIEAYVRGG